MCVQIRRHSAPAPILRRCARASMPPMVQSDLYLCRDNPAPLCAYRDTAAGDACGDRRGGVGGGFELALACDLRIAAAEAKVGLPEVKLELIPGAGGTQRLTRLVGRGLANRMILTAETVDGVTAERLGIVQWCYPKSELAPRAADIARRIAALPRAALAAAKLCVAAAAEPGRGGFADDSSNLSATERSETRQRVGAFLTGAG